MEEAEAGIKAEAEAKAGGMEGVNGAEGVAGSTEAPTTYIGIIADEAPDIVCDAEKKNINLYSYASLVCGCGSRATGAAGGVRSQIDKRLNSQKKGAIHERQTGKGQSVLTGSPTQPPTDPRNRRSAALHTALRRRRRKFTAFINQITRESGLPTAIIIELLRGGGGGNQLDVGTGGAGGEGSGS